MHINLYSFWMRVLQNARNDEKKIGKLLVPRNSSFKSFQDFLEHLFVLILRVY